MFGTLKFTTRTPRFTDRTPTATYPWVWDSQQKISSESPENWCGLISKISLIRHALSCSLEYASNHSKYTWNFKNFLRTRRGGKPPSSSPHPSYTLDRSAFVTSNCPTFTSISVLMPVYICSQ